MAVTTDPNTATDLQYTIPEFWLPIVQEELFAKTIAANWFKDLTSYIPRGADIANIPEVFTNSFTANTQTTQGAEITTESVAQGNVQLSINTHSYIAYLIGDKDAVQLLSSFDFQATYARKAAGTLRDGLEDALLGLWSGLTTNSVGDTATYLTDVEIRTAIEKLDTANFELEDIAWFLHPETYWTQVAAIQKYYDAAMRGMNPSITVNGNFGEMNKQRSLRGILYGFPIFVSSNVVSGLLTHRNLLAHRDAFCFANQTPGATGSNNVRIQAKYMLENLGTLAVVDILYGVKELRDAAAVVVNASNAYLVS